VLEDNKNPFQYYGQHQNHKVVRCRLGEKSSNINPLDPKKRELSLIKVSEFMSDKKNRKIRCPCPALPTPLAVEYRTPDPDRVKFFSFRITSKINLVRLVLIAYHLKKFQNLASWEAYSCQPHGDCVHVPHSPRLLRCALLQGDIREGVLLPRVLVVHVARLLPHDRLRLQSGGSHLHREKEDGRVAADGQSTRPCYSWLHVHLRLLHGNLHRILPGSKSHQANETNLLALAHRAFEQRLCRYVNPF
jgi:hypothetical protein